VLTVITSSTAAPTEQLIEVARASTRATRCLSSLSTTSAVSPSGLSSYSICVKSVQCSVVMLDSPACILASYT
jgi:hypothetical protein